jgi:hypothetical protein
MWNAPKVECVMKNGPKAGDIMRKWLALHKSANRVILRLLRVQFNDQLFIDLFRYLIPLRIFQESPL